MQVQCCWCYRITNVFKNEISYFLFFTIKFTQKLTFQIFRILKISEKIENFSNFKDFCKVWKFWRFYEFRCRNFFFVLRILRIFHHITNFVDFSNFPTFTKNTFSSKSMRFFSAFYKFVCILWLTWTTGMSLAVGKSLFICCLFCTKAAGGCLSAKDPWRASPARSLAGSEFKVSVGGTACVNSLDVLLSNSTLRWRFNSARIRSL